MPYEKVVLSEALGANNELGKPATFLGIMKNSPEGLSIWTDNRREIILAFGKNEADGPFYIGEVRKKDAHYVWVWAIPVPDIRGYDDLVKEIKKKQGGIAMKCKNCGERYDPRDSIEAEWHEELICESKKKGEFQ